ncbi:MAG: phosphatase PAP2 family protein [Acidobacteriota bacterium]|nr:phosphatase PAP2 family protein [Acidobacteriota bacterium]
MNVSRSACTLVFALALSAPAWAQDPLPVEAAPVEGSTATEVAGAPGPVEGGSDNFFKMVAGDFKNFFNSDTAKVMGYFSIAAAAAAPWDRKGVNNGFNIPTTVFQGGNLAGSFPFQLGAGVAAYGVGRSFGNARTATVGRDIMRAQILSQVLVQGMKVTIRRERPDKSNSLSFPSGHAASAFATAGVLHKHYGWKAGVPAYAFGSYVALARMSWNRHHATDVVMGAGFGLASARTVTMRMGGKKFSVGVQPQVGGASVHFTRIYK